MEFKNFYLGK